MRIFYAMRSPPALDDSGPFFPIAPGLYRIRPGKGNPYLRAVIAFLFETALNVAPTYVAIRG